MIINKASNTEMYNCCTIFYSNKKNNAKKRLKKVEKGKYQGEKQVIAEALSTKDYKIVVL